MRGAPRRLQSYHLLSAGSGAIASAPRDVFAWCVRGVVQGLVDHGAYVRVSQQACHRPGAARQLRPRFAELAALDANPMAELVGGLPDEAAFRRCWNGYNRLAPLGVDTQLQPHDGTLRRIAHGGAADSAFRRDTIAACVSGLRARAGDPDRADGARHLAAAWQALGNPGDGVPDALAALAETPEADLARTAARLACSPRTLQRQLTQAGLNFGLLRQAVRIGLASRQLRRGTASLTEVAHASGFFDSAHFTRAWRQSCGITPSDYRALCRLATADDAGEAAA